MRWRLAIMLLLLSGGAARAQSQGWQADQDGSGFACYDVGYFQGNNLAGTGTRCVEADSTGKLIPMSVDCLTVPLTEGVVENTVSGGASALVIFPADATRIPFGSGSHSGLTDGLNGPHYDPATGKMWVGYPGPPSVWWQFDDSQNAASQLIASNANAGNQARAIMGVSNSQAVIGVGQQVEFQVFGSGWSFGGGANPGDGLDEYIGGGSGAFMIGHDGTGPINVVRGASRTVHAILDDGSGNFSLPISLGGGGTQCVEADNTGKLFPAACGGSGTVTSVGGTAQRISVVNPTTTPVVDTIGGYYSGAVTSGNEDLGTTLTNGLVCDTTTAGVAVLRTCASGTDYQPPTAKTCTGGQFLNEIDVTGAAVCASPPGGTVTSVTGADGVVCSPTSPNPTCTLANLTCGANTFVSSASSGSGLVCTQPSFANLNGSATCSQLPALTGPDVVSSAGSCANKVKGVTDGANVDWPVTGTFANNQAMITSGGSWTTTNECNVFASCAAGGGLAGTYPNPSVASVPCSALPALTGAITSSAGSCATALATDVGIRTLSYDFFGLSAGGGWLVTGSDSSVKTFGGFAVEYPLGGAFSTCRLRAVNGINTGAGYTALVLTITRNGTATAATLSIPASSATALFDSGFQTISSGAITDTYGVELTYTGATVPAGITDFTVTAACQ